MDRQIDFREFPQRFHPRFAGHRQIEQQDVWLKLTCQGNRLLPIRGLAHNSEILFIDQQPSQAVAKNGMVIGNDDPDCGWIRQFEAPSFLEL